MNYHASVNLVCDRKPRLTLKTTELNLLVRIGSSKSEAEVTNNERVRSRYCTVEANCRQAQNIARLLCDS